MNTSWAYSTKTLAHLEQHIIQNGIQSVIECGSGHSTLLLADLHDRGIISNWLSLEHNPAGYEHMLKLLRQAGYTTPNICLCPLVNTWAGRWYNMTDAAYRLLRQNPANLVIVDGPPDHIAVAARYPAVPLLKPYLKRPATIILNDADCPDQQQIVDRWTRKWGLTLIEQVPTDKGMAILKMPA